MKVENIKVWKDLKENKVRTPKEPAYEISKERYEEILKVGKFVKEVKEEKTPKKKGD